MDAVVNRQTINKKYYYQVKSCQGLVCNQKGFEKLIIKIISHSTFDNEGTRVL